MFRVALWMSTLIALGGARIYERCELARDLQILGVHRDQIATWVCIAYHESRFDTAAFNPGSGDHGLLQISELYWCGPGKACGAPCSAFRDEDISNDVKCALKIYREHTRLQGDGFLAWVVYPHHCKHNAKKYVHDCDKNLKNVPVKYDDRARYLKSAETNDTQPNITNDPYVNRLRPQYLAINSVIQESYINDIEQNYYNNNKESLNWSNFKVDNIDALKLPAAEHENQSIRFIESSTPPTTTTTVDPALIGIKPPSPRKIETNQFRRRKTFSEPLVFKNKISSAQKTIKTSSEKEKSESTLTFNEDLSHNIFLNLSPAANSKSLIELSPQQTKLTDYHIKMPEAEETSPNKILTYDDLAQNPFLKSLPPFKFKSSTEVPLKANTITNLYRKDYISSTHIPFMYAKNGPWLYPEKKDNLEGFKKISSEYDESATIKILSYEDLSQNLFLSHILKPSTHSPLFKKNFPETSENFKTIITVTTVKPSKHLESSESTTLSTQVNVSTRSPYKPLMHRGNVRFFSNIDSTSEKPSPPSSSTTQAIRRYNLPRQRYNINRNRNLLSKDLSTANTSKDNDSEHISTTISYSQRSSTNGNQVRIEATTAKPSTSLDNILPNVTEEKEASIRPQTLSETRTTSSPWTTPYSQSSSQSATDASQNINSTSQQPNYNLRSSTDLSTSSTFTTRPFYASSEKVITESTTSRTTQSIFDLYLKPSTRAAFTPFVFTTSINKNPYRLSIFSGGTTKPPPSFYHSRRRTTRDEVQKN